MSVLLTVEPASTLNKPADPKNTAPGDKVAPDTVSVVLPDLLPVATDEVAVITDVPAVTPVARPLPLMVAIPGVPEVQVTALVKSTVVASENVPVALNCWVWPLLIVGIKGVTAMELKVTLVTVSVVVPVLLPVATDEVAVITDEPALTPVARPLMGLMVAKAGVPDVQTTKLVISTDVPSENMPRALNCWGTPTGMLGFAGAIVSELKVAFFTVSSVAPNLLPVANDDVAVISVWPAVKPIATPLAGSMLATAVVPDRQVTELVRSAEVPSEKTPVARNCWGTPAGMLGFAGDTITEFKVALLTVSTAVVDLLPVSTVEVAVITVWPAAVPVARPRALMVATAVVPDCQATEAVISADVPSENTPSALYC
jgi:hypothetical protein